jgi:hypothetical protein
MKTQATEIVGNQIEARECNIAFRLSLSVSSQQQRRELL